MAGFAGPCQGTAVDDALCMHVEPDLREPTLIACFEGWNDAGEAASTAVRYVADAIQAVPLANIDPEEFYDFTVQRPHVLLDADGKRQIEWPENEFRFGSLDPTREVVTAIGVEPHFRWQTFSGLIARLVQQLDVRRVVLLGAYMADVVYSRPVQVVGFASQENVLDEIGVEPTRYQGPTGIVGVLADRLQRDQVDVVSLWAGLPHYITVSPNPRGALALLQKLGALLDLKIDDLPLQKSAAEFEQRISSLVSSDPQLADYVRQLKRREFAQ